MMALMTSDPTINSIRSIENGWPPDGANTRVGGTRMGDIGTSVPGLSSPSIVQISPPDIARRRLSTWGGIQADNVQVTRRETFEYGFQDRRDLLIVHERAERHDGETFIEGLPKSTLREFNCRLSFVPAGHRFYGWQTPRVLTRVTYLYIDLQHPLFDLDSGIACPTISPRLFFFDQAIWDTALKLKTEVGNSNPDSRQYADALSLVLTHELVRLERTRSAATKPLRGGLPAWQQKRVVEFIEEHLAEDISLAALAELVDLSVYHFARAFAQSFGAPPHRYHMGRRMDRAKSLLQSRALSVTQIGIRTGFREASSFTRAFRRFTGLTPTEYRRHRED
jgi:AraC-like DNA-binding protein